jgi:hypothetical protein
MLVATKRSPLVRAVMALIAVALIVSFVYFWM